MENLVQIKVAVIGNEEQPTVDARELWVALKSKQEFANWIKDRLECFVNGYDYCFDKIIKTGRNITGKQVMNEYTLTLDTAKHLAMLERNEQGRKVRQYFIEVEKAHRKKAMRPEDILRDSIIQFGAEWILERIQLCEIYDSFYAPKHKLGERNGYGHEYSTIRRASNPVRGGRIPSKRERAIITQPHLFGYCLLNNIKKMLLE